MLNATRHCGTANLCIKLECYVDWRDFISEGIDAPDKSALKKRAYFRNNKKKNNPANLMLSLETPQAEMSQKKKCVLQLRIFSPNNCSEKFSSDENEMKIVKRLHFWT